MGRTFVFFSCWTGAGPCGRRRACCFFSFLSFPLASRRRAGPVPGRLGASLAGLSLTLFLFYLSVFSEHAVLSTGRGP